MKIFLVILACAVLAHAQNIDSREHGVTPTNTRTNCTCGWSNRGGNRIVNGRGTLPHEYPMMAGLVIHKVLVYCGGTVITKKHVLTAAHCTLGRDPSIIGIHVGHNNYEKVKSTNALYAVDSFIENPKFAFKHMKYDISLVLIKGQFAFSQNIGPACLPTKRLKLIGQKVKVLGWGRTKDKGPTSPDLLKVYLDVKPNEDCYFTNLLIEKFDIHQMCTFTRGQDSCQGDSGGPVLWLDPETNRYVLVALTSYGSGCGQNPAINSEVAYFLPWIQQVIASTSNEKTCGKA